MIAVIADDFTGAAEIAGLGLRYGLKVEIESHVHNKPEPDLLIVATDTRSMEPDDAYNEVFTITKRLKELDCDLIYKKTDSVFRGHIYKELLAIIKANGYDKALLVPANPSLGRVLKDGIYYIKNKYLHETNFADDPDFPLTTSNVLDLIKAEVRSNVHLVNPDQNIVRKGITIGEVLDEQDLKFWASKVDKTILPAGGAEFFKALLEVKGYKKKFSTISKRIPFGKNFLIVCGSAYSKGKAAFTNVRNSAIKTVPMPDRVFYNSSNAEESFKKWKKNVIQAIHNHTFVIIEIDQPVVRDKKYAKRLREEMARLVNDVLQQVDIDELLIDGGATVYSIMERVGFAKFFPTQELSPGVIRMRVQSRDNLFVTIKPGSYLWPELVLNLLSAE